MKFKVGDLVMPSKGTDNFLAWHSKAYSYSCPVRILNIRNHSKTPYVIEYPFGGSMSTMALAEWEIQLYKQPKLNMRHLKGL